MSDEFAKPLEIPSAQSVSPRCPLCGGTQATSIDSLTPAEIQIAWRTVGVPVSRAALGDLAQADRVHHWRCANCLFEYSDPNYAGGAKFYEELQTALPRYYPSEALEFARALAFARANKLSDVLDVGCGAGAFLNLAKSAGLRTHGIELNPKAAAIAEAGGHVIYSQLLHEIIAAAGGKQPRFSLVTAWQVLEHVPDPGAFLRDCAQFVKAGGYLAVAVPTEAGINRLCPYNPHLWPPHHVTRWRLAHLRKFGEKAGLKYVSGGNDPLDAGLLRHLLTLHNQLATALSKKPYAGGKLLPRVISQIYSKTGMRHYMPKWGQSTYAFFTN